MHLTKAPSHIGSSSVRDLTREHIFTMQLQILLVFFLSRFLSAFWRALLGLVRKPHYFPYCRLGGAFSLELNHTTLY